MYRTALAAESAGLRSTSDGTRTSRACRDSSPYTPDYRLKGLAASEIIDRHAVMTIVGRMWNRLTKVIRERVGTAGKTASSRDLHLAAVALTQNADPVRPQIAQARAFVQGGGAR